MQQIQYLENSLKGKHKPRFLKIFLLLFTLYALVLL
jgi:hypothetical protein